MPPRKRPSECNHSHLLYEPSAHGSEVGYVRPGIEDLSAATRTSRKQKDQKWMHLPMHASTFPAPLVLPGDELSFDPQAQMQTAQDWVDEEHRNPITPDRSTVYVVPPPKVSESFRVVNEWARPTGSEANLARPQTADILEYLSAFYCGLPVRILESPPLVFTKWEDSTTKTKAKGKSQARTKNPKLPSYVGLQLDTQVFGIRTRKGPDSLYPQQLNLNDLLDVAIEVLPRDAYAIMMLTHHDLYEDESDDFCCGRAYGGSRVSIVSTARYHPRLDDAQQVERSHAWPASHCQDFITGHCDANTETTSTNSSSARKRPKTTAKSKTFSDPPRPDAIQAAVTAFKSLPLSQTAQDMELVWLGRVCKTASHELGHCFGMDHCTYFACIMQGTAGLSEDAGQPPYLCPVDLAKVLHAVPAGAVERYKSLLQFCSRWSSDRLFSAFAAWLRIRIDECS